MSHQIEFDLPARPDAASNAALLGLLRSNPQLSVRISAAERRRLDVPLLQILIAASQHWRSRGLDFALTELSADHIAELALMGFHPDLSLMTPLTYGADHAEVDAAVAESAAGMAAQ